MAASTTFRYDIGETFLVPSHARVETIFIGRRKPGKFLIFSLSLRKFASEISPFPVDLCAICEAVCQDRVIHTPAAPAA